MLMLLFVLTMSSCAAIGGIFKAGMVWGIILVIGIIALILFLISRGGKK